MEWKFGDVDRTKPPKVAFSPELLSWKLLLCIMNLKKLGPAAITEALWRQRRFGLSEVATVKSLPPAVEDGFIFDG